MGYARSSMTRRTRPRGTVVDRAFRPVLGKPCWGVRLHGDGVLVNFGAPHLEIREPAQDGKVGGVVVPPPWLKDLARRKVFVFGEWHLVVWRGAEWSIQGPNGTVRSRDGKRPSATRRQQLERGLERIDSQTLVGFSVNTATASCSWEFELGGVLTVKPGVAWDRVTSLWSFFEPDRNVVVVRADGRYCHIPVSSLSRDATWRRLTSTKPTT